MNICYIKTGLFVTVRNGMLRKTHFYLLLILPATLSISCNNEKEFTISAYITGIADSTQVMLQNLTTGEFIDSSMVIDSEFAFNGNLKDEPEELRIISGLEELKKGTLFYTDLLIGNEDVELTADISDLPYNVAVSGSATQDEVENYHKQLHSWNLKLDKLKKYSASLEDSADSPGKIQAELRVSEVNDSLQNWRVEFIKENFNSYIGLLTYHYWHGLEIDTLKKLFDNVPEELMQSKYGQAIATQISHPQPRVGDTYYDFEAITPTDDSFRLSEIDDRYILLQFAGTGCYPSGISVQEMKTIYPKYKDSISFLSYFIDPQKELWINYTNTNKLPWTSLWEAGGKYSNTYNKYWIVGTPTFFLISPDRKVVASWFGYEEGIIDNNVQKVFERARGNARNPTIH